MSHSLSKKNLRGIVALEMIQLGSRLADRQIVLSTSDSALDYLAEIGYDGVYGARPLKRVIQREVEKRLATLILGDELSDGDLANVGVDDNDRITVDVVRNGGGSRKTEGEGAGQEQEQEVAA